MRYIDAGIVDMGLHGAKHELVIFVFKQLDTFRGEFECWCCHRVVFLVDDDEEEASESRSRRLMFYSGRSSSRSTIMFTILTTEQGLLSRKTSLRAYLYAARRAGSRGKAPAGAYPTPPTPLLLLPLSPPLSSPY